MERKQTVFKAALGLSVLSMISKLLGFAREQAIAWRFGAGAAVDSYVAALVVPTVLAALLGGAIGTAFLPVFSSERAAGRGRIVSSTMFYASLAISLVGAVVAYAFAPFIVRGLVGNFPVDQQVLTVKLLRILSAGTLLMGLSFPLTMLFNGYKQFGVPALGPLIHSSIVLIGLMAFGAVTINVLAWYTLLGMAVPVLMLTIVAIHKGYHLFDRPKFCDPAFVQVVKLSAPIFVSGLFGQVYMIVDRRLASGLDIGSIASLNFASKLVQLPVGIFVTALVTAVYPTFAQHAARDDKRLFAEAVSASLRGLILLIIPATVGLFVLRHPIVRLAFERGSFDASATAKTALALGYYAVGLLGLSAVQVLGRAFYALRDSMTPVKVGFTAALVNVALAMMLVGPLSHGGLALAHSIGLLLNAGILLYILSTKLEKGTVLVMPVFIKSVLAAALMGVVTGIVLRLSAGMWQIGSLVIAVSIGIAVYVAFLALLKVDEVLVVLNLVQQRLDTRKRKIEKKA